MIKNLRFFLLAFMAMLGFSAALADSVTFTPAEFTPATNSDFSLTKSGITVSVTSSTVNADEIRIFKYQTITISSTEGNISNIEFTCTASGVEKYGPGCFNAQEGYSFDNNKGTWTGDAASVSFTAESNQVRATQIVVTVGEGGGVTPTPDPEPVDVETEGEGTLEKPYTVADAIKVASALAQGAQTATDVYVSGVISSIKFTFDAEHGTATFNISADGEAADEFQCYSVYYLENRAWVEGNTQIEQGDEVIIYGRLTNFNGTLETASKKAYIYSLNGQTKNEVEVEPVAEPTIEGGTTPETAITVEAAVAAINSMNNGQTTTAEYYVKGIVTLITEIGTSYGNATFTIRTSAEAQDSLYVFHALGLQKGSISDAEYLNVGDEVIVSGKLQKYVKNDAVIPELAQGGYIYSINGNTQPEEKPLELVGDGSKENPYLVSDLKQLDPNKITIEGNVYVKGIIVGALNNNNVEGESTEVNTNLAIAATAEASVKDEVVPVELKNNTIFRENLNIPAHKDLIGKEIVFYGQLVKYFSIVGVKNLEAYILNGVEISSGIAEVKTADRFQNAVYNLRGQRVKTPAKGLFIMNGKKYFVK